MKSLVNQTLKEIQILLSFSEKENQYDIIKHFTKYDKRVKIYITNEKDLINNIFFLLEKAKGKFIYILNKFILLNYDELERFYNYTKGKSNHIFKFISNNGNDIQLIKTKYLKDLSEEEFKFANIKDMINYIYLSQNPYLNYISIVFCPNNFYTSYTYVAMISILNSKYYYTFISFYLIISEDFDQKNIDFLNSLYDQYDLFNITFIKMDNKYNNAYTSRYLTKETYYRFSSGELINLLNFSLVIICLLPYLDTDIIVYNDLTDFYNLNFNGKVILGQPTYFNRSPKTGLFKINNGILLLNLKKMRKMKIEKKVLYILNNAFQNDFHDQFLLNHLINTFMKL